MAIEERQQTIEEKQSVEARTNKMSSDLAQSIIKTYDLPTSIASAVDEEQERKEKLESSETSQEDAESTNSDTPSAEDGAEAKAEEVESDLDPVTDSVQKRIDELTREKKQLEARLKKLETQSAPTEQKDADLDKLEKMSVDELRETKKKVLRAQRTAADDATLDQLFELEEKITRTIEDAPKRFQTNQLERFNEVVANTTDLSEKELEVVFGHAKNIFTRTPSFQKSVDGQAEAWQLAVDHYREMNKLTVGKSKVNELERKVNDLKKKTSLDSAVQKGNAKVSEEAKLYNKARGGDSYDKQAFFKKRLNTDSLIPEEFRR
jgi:hypothetical protein